jgi:hypothetical protein
VIGGVIMGNNPADDYFVQSHGVKTPDAFWKVVIRGTGQDERAIAWVVPNSKDATRKHLDNYLVSVDELEKLPARSYRWWIMQSMISPLHHGSFLRDVIEGNFADRFRSQVNPGLRTNLIIINQNAEINN